jgi:hypothetical protein
VARTSGSLLSELRPGRLSEETCLAICSGVLPMPAAERAELLCVLAAHNSRGLACAAEAALSGITHETILPAFKWEDTAPELFLWCASHLGHQQPFEEALADHPAFPADLLVPLIPRLSETAVHGIFDGIERLAASQALIAALGEVTFLTAEERSILEELQGAVPAREEQCVTDGAMEDSPASETPPQTQSLAQRLIRMTVLERIQLAMRGSREERGALIRDSNKVVQRAVLQSPRITPQEIESFAAMTSLASESLRWIGANRSLMKQYLVVRKLVNNPKTPLDIALRFIPRLNQADLKILTRNKNVADALRSTASHRFNRRSTPG